MDDMGKRIITCRELDRFLADYVSGELTADRRSLFEEHLALCPTCVRYVEHYRQTVRIGKAAFGEPDLPAPDEVPAELIDAIVEVRRKERFSSGD